MGVYQPRIPFRYFQIDPAASRHVIRVLFVFLLSLLCFSYLSYVLTILVMFCLLLVVITLSKL